MARFTRKYLLRNLFGNDYWFLACASFSHSSYQMPTLKALRWHCCSVIYWKHTGPNVTLYHNLVNQIGLFQKKPKHGGVKIWNFQGYQRNSMCNFQRLRKSHVEFPGVLVFGLGISKGWNTILQNFQVWSSVLPRISRGKVKKWKIPGGFSKKYVLNPPFCFFSGIAHCRIYDKMGIWEFEMVQNCLLSWSITRTVFCNLLSFYWCW